MMRMILPVCQRGAWGGALSVMLSVTLLASCGPGGVCPDEPARLSLVDHEAWQPLAMDEDPFTPGADDDIYPCDDRDMTVEELGEVVTWSVVTGACNWATVAQPLPRALAAGEELLLEMFWFSQRDFPGATAIVGLALADEVVFTHPVQVPADAELLEAPIVVPRDIEEGTRVSFHVGNHGTNSWNLIDLSVPNDVERPAWCPAPDDDKR